MRVLFTIFFFILLVLMLPLALAAVYFVLQAEVNHTRFFGFGLLALSWSVYLGFRHFSTDAGRPALWAALWLAVGCGFLGASYLYSPTGVSTREAMAFQSVYEDGADGAEEAHPYPRWHPANLVAERDQVRVALAVCGLIGRDYDDARGGTARRVMSEIYADLEYHAEELVDFGSQLYRCYDALLDRPSGDGAHRYVYRSPKGAEKGKMPVILLLHSDSGNLKAGLWALKDLADDLGTAIVAPTFGAGKWQEDNARARIVKALGFIERTEDLDATAIVLVGYGTGGAGVNRAARTLAKRFRGFAHVAAEFTPESTIGLAEPGAFGTLPMLVLHGADDRLVRIEDVEKAVDGLKKWRLPVTYQRFEDEGAMLLFKRSADVSNRIAAWMRTWRSR